jgi:hypothetical protein
MAARPSITIVCFRSKIQNCHLPKTWQYRIWVSISCGYVQPVFWNTTCSMLKAFDVSEAIYSSEASVDLHLTTRRYIPEERRIETTRSGQFLTPLNWKLKSYDCTAELTSRRCRIRLAKWNHSWKECLWRRSATRSWSPVGSLAGWLARVIGWNHFTTGHRVAIETWCLITIPPYRAVQLKHKAGRAKSYSIGQYVSKPKNPEALRPQTIISNVRVYMPHIPLTSTERKLQLPKVPISSPRKGTYSSPISPKPVPGPSRFLLYWHLGLLSWRNAVGEWSHPQLTPRSRMWQLTHSLSNTLSRSSVVLWQLVPTSTGLSNLNRVKAFAHMSTFLNCVHCLVLKHVTYVCGNSHNLRKLGSCLFEVRRCS